jgi:galactose-1-phosphate uridylyltransferase
LGAGIRELRCGNGLLESTSARPDLGSDFVPNEPALGDPSQRDYLHERKRTMLADYAQREMKMDERVVVSNSYWVAVVPFWAGWPFQVLCCPRTSLPSH